MSPSQQVSTAMASPHSSSSSSASSGSGSPPPPAMTPTAQQTTPVRKPISEHRRCNKPIMEKKRRQRINNCLDELKNLILDALKKDPARHSKLEKADILEMTVKHLESLHRQQSAMAVATDPSVLNKYRAGFSECAAEVDKFLGRGDAPQLDPHVKRRLLAHLTSCLSNVTVVDGVAVKQEEPTSPTPLQQPPQLQPRTLRVQIPASSMQIPATGGVMHLVPTCLPSGDIAFVIPKAVTRASPPPPPVARLSPSPPPLLLNENESPQSLAARTAVVAPLSVALDLSISNVVPLKQEEKQLLESVPGGDPMEQDEDVWRPW